MVQILNKTAYRLIIGLSIFATSVTTVWGQIPGYRLRTFPAVVREAQPFTVALERTSCGNAPDSYVISRVGNDISIVHTVTAGPLDLGGCIETANIDGLESGLYRIAWTQVYRGDEGRLVPLGVLAVNVVRATALAVPALSASSLGALSVLIGLVAIKLRRKFGDRARTTRCSSRRRHIGRPIRGCRPDGAAASGASSD